MVLADADQAWRAEIEGFEAAHSRRPEIATEIDYEIAGALVRVQVVGKVLAEETERALRHLRTGSPADPPALRVDLWDAEAAGVPIPPRSLPEGLGPYGYTCASKDGRYAADVRRESIALLDRSRHRIVSAVSGAGRRYLDERARPVHRLLSIWFGDRSIQFVHSGLVETEGGGILLVGAGGSGKSTTTLLCLRNGLGFLGDDFVGLESGPGEGFVGHSLFGTSVVSLDHLVRFPEITARALPPNGSEEEKWLLFPDEIYPGRMRRCVPIRALAVVRVAACAATSFRPASRSEALLGLAPSSLMLLAGAGARCFETLCDLVDSVPCYRLEVGEDMERIPAAVAGLLERVAA